MSLLSYNPRLLIDGVEDVHLLSANFISKNNNTISSLSARIGVSELKETKLFGTKVQYFLNCGSEDGFPIFVGFIKQVNATESSTSFTAVDVRGFLSDAQISLTDSNNYDGYTLGSFLREYIDKHINDDNNTFIDTSKINDTNPKVSLTGKRGEFTVLSLVNTSLQDAVDDNQLDSTLNYTLDVLGDSIIFKKKQRLDSNPSMSLSTHNGIISFNYRERPVIFKGIYDDRTFTYGSNPTGPFNKKIKTDKEHPAEKAKDVYLDIVTELNNNKEITIKSSVGHYLGLDSIIHLNVDDSNISGPHRVVSKNISFTNRNMSLTLGLNNIPAKISEYFNQ